MVSALVVLRFRLPVMVIAPGEKPGVKVPLVTLTFPVMVPLPDRLPEFNTYPPAPAVMEAVVPMPVPNFVEPPVCVYP